MVMQNSAVLGNIWVDWHASIFGRLQCTTTIPRKGKVHWRNVALQVAFFVVVTVNVLTLPTGGRDSGSLSASQFWLLHHVYDSDVLYALRSVRHTLARKIHPKLPLISEPSAKQGWQQLAWSVAPRSVSPFHPLAVDCATSVRPQLCLHGIPTLQDVRWYPSLCKVLLQLRHLR
jgi:hypothetical protein